jgi:hypothetical protein
MVAKYDGETNPSMVERGVSAINKKKNEKSLERASRTDKR